MASNRHGVASNSGIMMASNRHGVASNSGIMITGRQLTESGLMLNKFTIFWPKSITAGLMIEAENCPGLYCKTITKFIARHDAMDSNPWLKKSRALGLGHSSLDLLRILRRGG